MNSDFESPDALTEVSPVVTSKPNGQSTQPPPAPSKVLMFAPVSLKAAAAAKKGNTSNSRTGKGKQASFSFGSPGQNAKNLYFRSSPSPAHHALNLPVFFDESRETYHYINPDLYESGILPSRFQAACKLMDVHVVGVADGTFFLWRMFVSASAWRRSAIKVLEAAKCGFIVTQTLKRAQTYTIEPATEPIPEPKWESLPSFEAMLLDGFDSSINVNDDKVVTDFMSGGVALSEEEDGD